MAEVAIIEKPVQYNIETSPHSARFVNITLTGIKLLCVEKFSRVFNFANKYLNFLYID